MSAWKANIFTFGQIFTMLISVRGGISIIQRLFLALILSERCHTYFHNKNAASSTTMADSGKCGTQWDLSGLSLNLNVAGPQPGTKPTVRPNESRSISLKQRPQRGAAQSPPSYATLYKDQFMRAQRENKENRVGRIKWDGDALSSSWGE